MICYNSGCSFTSPTKFTKNEEMYWYYLAQDRGCTEFVNVSRPGSSNDRIFQKVYDHVLANLDTEVLYIINVTSINRIELEPNISDKLQDVLTPAALARYDFETVELNLFTQLVAIISFLRTHNKDFYIINNSKELSFSPYPPRDRFTEFLVQEPRAINLFKNSKFNFHRDVSGIKPYDYDQYGWSGHDAPEGHRAYYEFLKTLLPKFL